MRVDRGSIEARAALGLVLVGTAALPFVRASDLGLGAVALPWLVAVVLAAIAIVRLRGRTKPWPAYAALGVVVVGVLASITPPGEPPRAREDIDTDVLAARLSASGGAARHDLVSTCASALGRPCTADELERAAASGDPSGLRTVEWPSRKVDGVGELRITSTIDPAGRVRTSCRAVDANVPEREAKAACDALALG